MLQELHTNVCSRPLMSAKAPRRISVGLLCPTVSLLPLLISCCFTLSGERATVEQIFRLVRQLLIILTTTTTTTYVLVGIPSGELGLFSTSWFLPLFSFYSDKEPLSTSGSGILQTHASLPATRPTVSRL